MGFKVYFILPVLHVVRAERSLVVSSMATLKVLLLPPLKEPGPVCLVKAFSCHYLELSVREL